MKNKKILIVCLTLVIAAVAIFGFIRLAAKGGEETDVKNAAQSENETLTDAAGRAITTAPPTTRQEVVDFTLTDDSIIITVQSGEGESEITEAPPSAGEIEFE